MRPQEAIATLLELVKPKPIAIKLLRKNLDIPSNPRLSNLMSDMKEKAFVTIERKEGLDNHYKITTVGRSHLNKYKGIIPSVEELIEYLLAYKPAKRGPIPVSSFHPSKKAKSAIEGISDLINTNNELMGLIRSMHRKLGDYLNGLEHTEDTDTSDNYD